MVTVQLTGDPESTREEGPKTGIDYDRLEWIGVQEVQPSVLLTSKRILKCCTLLEASTKSACNIGPRVPKTNISRPVQVAKTPRCVCPHPPTKDIIAGFLPLIWLSNFRLLLATKRLWSILRIKALGLAPTNGVLQRTNGNKCFMGKGMKRIKLANITSWNLLKERSFSDSIWIFWVAPSCT